MLKDVLEMLRDSYPERREQLTYSYVHKAYTCLRRSEATREIVQAV